MLDYRVWIQDLQQFLRRLPAIDVEEQRQLQIAPPLAHHTLRQLDSSLRVQVPQPVRDFLEHGSASCVSHFFWEPEEAQAEEVSAIMNRRELCGGAVLCDANQFGPRQEECLSGATDTWLASDADEKALWLRAFPFAYMPQGDFLALDPAKAGLPVTYLCHDDYSFPLCRSFDEFLAAWQGLCYLAPDHNIFRKFLDERGLLSPAVPQAQALRRLVQRCIG